MKRILLVTALCFISITSFAQGLDLGIKAGVNFATISDASGLDNRTGFVAGIFAGAKFNDNIGMQADLLYSQQGAEFEGDKFDLNYVNIPVVFKYYLIKGLNIQAGPQFGLLVDDNVTEVFSEIADAEGEDFDLSGVVGVGFDVPLGLRLEGRYNFGLSDVVKDADGKNSVITLSVGYSFL